MTRSQLWRQVACECGLAAILIGIGAGLRMAFVPWPNFSPVAALALIAGVTLNSRLLAFLVPLGIMLASDQFLGGYEFPVMLTVYGCLMFPVIIGRSGRRWLDRSKTGMVWRSMALGAVSGLVSSVMFFVLTNAAYWACFEWGHKSLLVCYVDAIPFFKYTFAGDLMFGTLLMGILAVMYAAVPQRSLSDTMARVN